MSSLDLLLRHCRLLHPDRDAETVDIAITEGRIVAIAPQLEQLAQQEVDVRGGW